MGYWKSKVLPKIKKVLSPKKAAPPAEEPPKPTEETQVILSLPLVYFLNKDWSLILDLKLIGSRFRLQEESGIAAKEVAVEAVEEKKEEAAKVEEEASTPPVATAEVEVVEVVEAPKAWWVSKRYMVCNI